MSSSISLLRALAIIGFLPLLAACDDQAASATAKPERPVQVQDGLRVIKLIRDVACGVVVGDGEPGVTDGEPGVG